MSMHPAQMYNALPDDIKSTLVDKFGASDAFTWFRSNIPDTVWDNPDAIRVLMDGGDATIVREIGDRGVAGGTYFETDTVTFPDRDFSRIESGFNGGEYTPDNVVLENASVNRSRGADNMTDADVDAARASLETDAELLDDAIIDTSASIGEIADASEPVAETIMAVPVESGSLLGDIGDAVLDGLLPATIGTHVAMRVADQFDDTTDKIGYGSLAAGGTVLLCLTPPGQLAMAGYVGWNVFKLAKRGIRAIDRQLSAT